MPSGPPGTEVAEHPTTAGVGLVLISTVIFGTTPALLTSLRGSLSIHQLVTFRSMVAAVLFASLAALIARRPRRYALAEPPDRQWSTAARSVLAGVALGAFFVAPDTLIFYTSFDYIDTSVAVALGFVYPVFVMLIVAAMSRRRPALRDVLLSASALVGVILIVNPAGTAHVRPAGVALVCTSAAIYATYAVVAGGLTRTVSPLVLGAQVMTGVCITGTVVSLIAGGPFVPPDLRSWALVCVNGALLVGAFAAYYAGLRRLGPVRSSLIDTAQPLAAALAGVALLGERLSLGQYAGVLVIVGSVAVSSALTGTDEVATVEPR